MCCCDCLRAYDRAIHTLVKRKLSLRKKKKKENVFASHASWSHECDMSVCGIDTPIHTQYIHKKKHMIPEGHHQHWPVHTTLTARLSLCCKPFFFVRQLIRYIDGCVIWVFACSMKYCTEHARIFNVFDRFLIYLLLCVFHLFLSGLPICVQLAPNHCLIESHHRHCKNVTHTHYLEVNPFIVAASMADNCFIFNWIYCRMAWLECAQITFWLGWICCDGCRLNTRTHTHTHTRTWSAAPSNRHQMPNNVNRFQ